MKTNIFLLVLVLLFGVAACSPALKTASPAQEVGKQNLPVEPAAAAPASQKAAATPAATAAPQTDAGQDGPSTTSPLAYAQPGSGMVIKDAELDLLVRDTSQALAQVTSLLAEQGGYIINSQTWYQDGYMYASLRLGIPSMRFEEALNGLRRVGLQVLKENAVGQDVSDQYVDLQSRLTNLEATAARVREFLKGAQTIEDSLRISQQLSDLEAQIEQVKGQMRYFEGRSAFSTVTVTLTPQYPTPTPTITATPTATPTLTPTPTPWSAANTFDQAAGVLQTQARTVADLLIWGAVVFGPWLVLALLAYATLRAALRRASIKQ